ncbi:uncharacterized protein N7496_005014 [Penicillium cataractarum]|uniref:Cystathionine gamma-synthase n=1 Tax=Penicillium cataractarum TaxID=2100454 RepID=A0A9W9VFI3_9EURO|nr:uncharacterized protein N7496_005014 [Penicillium cataractarum]KAJ5377605.1 hypothetical protein N7496_005014 [Penicillium cataractarum]
MPSWIDSAIPPAWDAGFSPSHDAANRLGQTLRKKEASARVYAVEFRVRSGHVNHPEVRKWARFVATLFPQSLATDAFLFWLNHGDCISNRHAQFCLESISAMDSVCEPHHNGFQTSGSASNIDMEAITLPTCKSSQEEKDSIKWTLARSTTSPVPGMKPVGVEDVFLYPTGMLAIGTIARALQEHASGEARAVIYGWVYSGTGPLVKDCGYDEFTMYGHGTEDELDQLEAILAAGTRITVVFCEITSNPQLYTPNLHRVKQLADEYGFVVVIDDTIGTSINVDILPYADVVTTSLTKIFSGACNVMGGSLIINPNSSHYTRIHTTLQQTYEDVFFPLDAIVLSHNSADYASRVRQCSTTAKSLAEFLVTHPLIESVNYPTLVPSRSQYDRYRRPGERYGYLLSIVFKDPAHAVTFFDALNVWKGPSIGTNSTIALPYSVLAHWEEGEWAAQYGVPRHIVRVSVGLEEAEELKGRFVDALQRIEAD